MKRLGPLMNFNLTNAMFSMFMFLAECITFQHPLYNGTCFADIRVVLQDPAWYGGTNAHNLDSSIWLTPDPRDGTTNRSSNIGKFVYKDRVQFKNNQSASPQKVASFNTSFDFQIITDGPYSQSGSGMAFFISAFDIAPADSHGRFLGLVHPNETHPSKFFAVEFDTHISEEFHDPSASHIGINVGSLVSLNTTDTGPSSSSPFYPELHLYNNYKFTAWIEYNSSTNLIQVWMTNSSSARRPPQACLQVTYTNLSGVFEDSMYVGFSATNKKGEDNMEGHVVEAWSFSSEDFVFSAVKSSAPKKNLIILLSLATILALGILIITLSLLHFKKQRNLINRVPSSIQRGCAPLQRYSYKELKTFAQGFTDQSKVGEGGFSSVYKAILLDGSTVAIKRLKESKRKEAEFCAEMNIISSLRHRNLLQLCGWCFEKREAMLVYKYMHNGSLDGYLHGKKKEEILTSEVRLKILVGVASALEYLHSNLTACVLHRDVKPANVLLDDGFEAMLGDFGLARLIGHDEGAVTMTAVGTPGYVAPEVVYTGKFTDKADVYSFGVLVLEIALGRPAVDQSEIESEKALLVEYAWMLHQEGRLLDALDPHMCMDTTNIHMIVSKREEWRCVLHVALMCCNPLPECRPNMRQVCQALKGDSRVLLTQPLPASRPLYLTNSIDWPIAFGSSECSSITSLEDGAAPNDMESPAPEKISPVAPILLPAPIRSTYP